MTYLRYILIGAAVLAIIAFFAVRQQRAMIAGLPPRVVCASPVDAHLQAGIGAIEVLGTGSMAPYIPKAPAGSDPLTTVVALVKPSERPFKSILKGDLVVYRPKWAKGNVMHQAAQKQGEKWIMSGLHNAQSESFEPIGEDQFVCIVDKVFVW